MSMSWKCPTQVSGDGQLSIQVKRSMDMFMKYGFRYQSMGQRYALGRHHRDLFLVYGR